MTTTDVTKQHTPTHMDIAIAVGPTPLLVTHQNIPLRSNKLKAKLRHTCEYLGASFVFYIRHPRLILPPASRRIYNKKANMRYTDATLHDLKGFFKGVQICGNTPNEY